jgi:hypothetical protein
VLLAIVVLLASNSLKWWSTFRLWNQYEPHQYWTDRAARRLFLIGKITPLITLLAIVALAYTTRFWWLEVPAWGILVLIAYGAVVRIARARRSAAE